MNLQITRASVHSHCEANHLVQCKHPTPTERRTGCSHNALCMTEEETIFRTWKMQQMRMIQPHIYDLIERPNIEVPKSSVIKS